MEVKVKSRVTEVDINSKNLQLKSLTQLNTHIISASRRSRGYGYDSSTVELFLMDEDLGQVKIEIKSEGVYQSENLQKLLEGIRELKNCD